MYARQLVELAALVALHGPLLIRSEGRISRSGLEQYWAASKCRFERWACALKQVSGGASGAEPLSAPATVHPLPAVMEEILTSEVLTRVWAAVLISHDQRRGTSDAEPIARSVLIGHLEARHRVLKLMVQSPWPAVEDTIRINHLRRRTERWTDLLIAHQSATHDVSNLASNPERASELAEELKQKHPLVWPLMMASLRAAFHRQPCSESPNADLNARIASSILASFPAHIFDSTGLLPSAWLVRLLNTTDDTQGLIRELFEIEDIQIKSSADELRRVMDTHFLRRRGLGDEQS